MVLSTFYFYSIINANLLSLTNLSLQIQIELRIVIWVFPLVICPSCNYYATKPIKFLQLIFKENFDFLGYLFGLHYEK